MISLIPKTFRLSILLLALVAIATADGVGSADPTFNAAVYGATSGTVAVTKRQSDGKILIAGHFTEVNGRAATGIARLNVDGSVDTTFNAPDFYAAGDPGGPTIAALGIQSDGKIIVVGNYDGVIGGDPGPGPRRLNPDGSLDSTFTSSIVLDGGFVRTLAIQPDDKILIGGSAIAGISLVRLNANGTVDQGFSGVGLGSVFSILVQPDGKLLVSGPATVKRVEANGALDNSFSGPSTNNGSVTDMRLRADGKIIVVGVFTTLNGTPAGHIGLLNANGSLDPTFNQGNSGADATIDTIELSPDGKVLIGGHFTAFNSVERQRFARLNQDGTLDVTLLNNASLSPTVIEDIAVLNDGRILVGSDRVSAPPAAVLLHTDGTTDVSREYIVSFQGQVRRIGVLASGKIIIVGEFNFVNGVRRRSIARLNSDGSLDTAFVPYFNSTGTSTVSLHTVVEQSDGKLLIGGVNDSFVQRLNADGSLDATFAVTFSTGSTVYDLALQPNGHVIVGGKIFQGPFTRRVIRLQPDGQPDAAFIVNQPDSDVYRVVRQPDGKILVGGDFTSLGAAPRGRIGRLNDDGTLDNSFDTSVGAAGPVFDIALQSDGKVIIGGAFSSLSGSSTRAGIGRLNADGSLDSGFAQTISDGLVIVVELQRDGKILVGGSFGTVGAVAQPRLARLNSNGSIDSAFSPSLIDPVLDIEKESVGRVLIGGQFLKVNGRSNLRIARLLTSATAFDFDGDGRADVSIFRPSTGTWWELFSSNSQFGQFAFGISGDLIAPADFDGDGETDEAIFRPSTGDFWYTRSIDGSAVNKHWGQAGDLPRPSDFDGDGLADLIVYRPSTGVWYRNGSTGQISIAEFGTAGDQPVVGDFDGDGKTDMAVFRPSTGDWWYAASGSGNQARSMHWGVTGDIPAAADYDADGRTDFAVFRPSNGVWYVSRSSDSSYTINAFGLDGDRPVPADYDGDGRADIAVFRPSTGVWYLLQSSSGTAVIQWGVTTDTSVPNAYVQP